MQYNPVLTWKAPPPDPANPMPPPLPTGYHIVWFYNGTPRNVQTVVQDPNQDASGYLVRWNDVNGGITLAVGDVVGASVASQNAQGRSSAAVRAPDLVIPADVSPPTAVALSLGI